MKIGIIGMGKVGEAIAQGIRQSEGSKRFQIQGTTRSEESASQAFKRLGIKCHTDNNALVQASEILILSVKPHQAEKVLREVAPQIGPKHLLISVCAAIRTAYLSEWSGGKAA